MAISIDSISKKHAMRAPRIVVYGVEGIGKTTTAAQAPDPIFILTEDGLGSIDVPHFPVAQSEQDVIDAIGVLYNEEHPYQTVVLDSLDWLDNHIVAAVEAAHDAKDLAYGKGAVLVAERWREVLNGFTALRNDKGMAVILIGHSHIRRFDSPETEPYDRYCLKLQERTSSLVREWADAVLFCNYKTIIRSTDVGFQKEVKRGFSTGERLFHTNERPAYQAKNRYALPDTIAMSWASLMEAMGAAK